MDFNGNIWAVMQFLCNLLYSQPPFIWKKTVVWSQICVNSLNPQLDHSFWRMFSIRVIGLGICFSNSPSIIHPTIPHKKKTTHCLFCLWTRLMGKWHKWMYVAGSLKPIAFVSTCSSWWFPSSWSSIKDPKNAGWFISWKILGKSENKMHYLGYAHFRTPP